MSMNPRLTFQVRRSSPAPWGSNEWAWRSALATEARAVASSVQGWPIIGACFVVKLTFYLAPSTWERVDLDNLAKPVLDTIFFRPTLRFEIGPLLVHSLRWMTSELSSLPSRNNWSHVLRKKGATSPSSAGLLRRSRKGEQIMLACLGGWYMPDLSVTP